MTKDKKKTLSLHEPSSSISERVFVVSCKLLPTDNTTLVFHSFLKNKTQQNKTKKTTIVQLQASVSQRDSVFYAPATLCPLTLPFGCSEEKGPLAEALLRPDPAGSATRWPHWKERPSGGPCRVCPSA